VSFGQEVLRVVLSGDAPSFSTLIALIRDRFHQQVRPPARTSSAVRLNELGLLCQGSFRLTYVDPEGDACAVTSDDGMVRLHCLPRTAGHAHFELCFLLPFMAPTFLDIFCRARRGTPHRYRKWRLSPLLVWDRCAFSASALGHTQRMPPHATDVPLACTCTSSIPRRARGIQHMNNMRRG
jgi:hypothetical protein